MGVINRAGPQAPDLSAPEPVDPDELRGRIDGGEWVVDLRGRTAFAAGHLAGTYGFELSGSFVNYLGWLYAWGAPLTLIGDDARQVAEAQRELARIGIDRLTGSATGDIRALASGEELRAYRVAAFEDLVDVLGDEVLADGRSYSTCASRANSTPATCAARSTSPCTNCPSASTSFPRTASCGSIAPAVTARRSRPRCWTGSVAVSS